MRWRLIAAFLLGIGCGGSVLVLEDGRELYRSEWLRNKDELERKASFDLACPVEDLRFQLITIEDRRLKEVGISGCGSRVRYMSVQGRWIANAASR